MKHQSDTYYDTFPESPTTIVEASKDYERYLLRAGLEDEWPDAIKAFSAGAEWLAFHLRRLLAEEMAASNPTNHAGDACYVEALFKVDCKLSALAPSPREEELNE